MARFKNEADSSKVLFACQIETIRETDAAIFAKLSFPPTSEYNSKTIWLPKSQVNILELGVELPIWLAKKTGIIDKDEI